HGGPPCSPPRRPLPRRGPPPPPALQPPAAGEGASLGQPSRPRLLGQHLRQLLLDLRDHRPLRPGGADERPLRPRRRRPGDSVPVDLFLPAHPPAAPRLPALAPRPGPLRRPLARRPSRRREP